MERLFSAEHPLIPQSLKSPVKSMLSADGVVWANESGFVTVAPLAGLPTQLEFVLWIQPTLRRKGLGSAFVTFVAQESLRLFPQAEVLTGFVNSLEGENGQFLLANNFILHHEELFLKHNLANLQSPTTELHALPKQASIETFQSLYNASFSPHRWYQPFNEDEIEQGLSDAKDMRFLIVDDKPIGFVWFHRNKDEILFEPIGVLPQFQGQGFGRKIVEAALWEVKQSGFSEARLGVWVENKSADSLYKSLGFTYDNSRYIVTKALLKY